MSNAVTGLKWYQFRLVSLLLFFGMVALGLGILVSPLPNRIAEEFDRVPERYVALSWMAMPARGSPGKSACVIRARWCAEERFQLQLRRQMGDSESDVGSLIGSRPQLVGHNAVIECEFSISGNCVRIVEDYDGERRLVGESRVSDPKNMRWAGIPVTDLLQSRWRKAGITGGGLHFLTCGNATKAGDDNAESFFFDVYFPGTR